MIECLRLWMGYAGTNNKLQIALNEALPGGEGSPMSLVWILKDLVSVFINASCRCRKLNKNSLSLSEF